MTTPIALSIALSTSCNWSRHSIDEASLRRAVCILELIDAADYSLAQDELRRFEREHAGHGDLTLVLDQWCQLRNSGSTAVRPGEAVRESPEGVEADKTGDPGLLQGLKQAGMTHYSRGNVEDAITCWETVVAVNPADRETVDLLRRARAVLAHKKEIRTNGPPGRASFSTEGTSSSSGNGDPGDSGGDGNPGGEASGHATPDS